MFDWFDGNLMLGFRRAVEFLLMALEMEGSSSTVTIGETEVVVRGAAVTEKHD